jgi:TetR/AcrR family transcriptional regulator, repressor of fatR-cypB operon
MNEHSFVIDARVSKANGILDAALAAFDELGYGETPMPVIAQRAGIAVGSIYRYFASKEVLVNELYRREKGRLAIELFAGVDLDGAPRVVFDAVWDRLGAFAAQSPAALCFLELHHHEAYLDAESSALAASVDRSVAELFARWQAQGVLRRGDPALLVAQVFGGFVGAMRHQRGANRPINAALAAQTREPAWSLLATSVEEQHE